MPKLVKEARSGPAQNMDLDAYNTLTGSQKQFLASDGFSITVREVLGKIVWKRIR